MIRNKVMWSPVELEYLTKNKLEDINQLCIALAKSRSAIDKKMKEIGLKKTRKTTSVVPNTLLIGRQSKVGLRKDLNLFLRSAWEANFLRLLKSDKLEYEFLGYEPRLFSFTDHVKPKGMALSYTPDFLVKKDNKEYWVEVKGNWLRSHDKTKLRRFKKYFPNEFKNFVVVVSNKNTTTAKFFLNDLGVPDANILEYNVLKKTYKKIVPNWED